MSLEVKCNRLNEVLVSRQVKSWFLNTAGSQMTKNLSLMNQRCTMVICFKVKGRNPYLSCNYCYDPKGKLCQLLFFSVAIVKKKGATLPNEVYFFLRIQENMIITRCYRQIQILSNNHSDSNYTLQLYTEIPRESTSTLRNIKLRFSSLALFIFPGLIFWYI